ncbi:MAG: PilW family protein [Candidatus Omnitrophota bacterium]
MKGFTLVEVLITIFIFGFIVAGLYGILNVATITYYTDLGLLDLHQQARNAIVRLVREVREANASSITVTAINPLSDRLTFDTPNKSGVQYYLSADQIIREYPAGTQKVIANNITRFKFTWNFNPGIPGSSRILRIAVQAEKDALRRHLSLLFGEQVRIRNE